MWTPGAWWCFHALLVSHLLSSTRSQLIPAAPTSTGPPQEAVRANWEDNKQTWAAYYHHLQSIKLVSQSIADVLAPELRYNYTLQFKLLRKSQAYYGSGARIRRVVKDLLTGERVVKIGVIGTSISWGTGATMRGLTDWWSVVSAELRKAFPKAKYQMRNGCHPATASSFANMCINRMVDEDVDLVFAEYITTDFPRDNVLMNNNMGRTYERLLRKVLNKPHNPALVLLQLHSWCMPCANNKYAFYYTNEDLYSTLGKYYDLPIVSFRDAVWQECEARAPECPSGWEAVMNAKHGDWTHPSDLGHRWIADLIMWQLHTVSVDLLMTPYSQHDEQPLPPPMYIDNDEEKQYMCLLDDDLRRVVDEGASQGWAWVNEGTEEKPKRGYVATSVGSRLVIHLNTSAVIGGAEVLSSSGGPAPLSVYQDAKAVAVLISFLKSYTDMGCAKVECAAGCKCEPQVIDAYHEQKTSTTFMFMFKTQASVEGCTVHVTVLDQSSSGTGHKFKVTGVMLDRMKSIAFDWQKPGVFTAVDSMLDRSTIITKDANASGVQTAAAHMAGQQAQVARRRRRRTLG